MDAKIFVVTLRVNLKNGTNLDRFKIYNDFETAGVFFNSMVESYKKEIYSINNLSLLITERIVIDHEYITVNQLAYWAI